MFFHYPVCGQVCCLSLSGPLSDSILKDCCLWLHCCSPNRVTWTGCCVSYCELWTRPPLIGSCSSTSPSSTLRLASMPSMHWETTSTPLRHSAPCQVSFQWSEENTYGLRKDSALQHLPVVGLTVPSALSAPVYMLVEIFSWQYAHNCWFMHLLFPDADMLLQQYATFLVDHFADSRIVSNGK